MSLLNHASGGTPWSAPVAAFLLLCLAALSSGCAAAGGQSSPTENAAGTPQLRGTVTYLPRIALPAKNTVTVRLLDVTQVDAPSIELGKQVIENAPGVPIPFAIAYDPARIDPRHSYCASATIEVDGKVMFRSTERFSVLTGNAKGSEPTVIVHLMPR